MGVHVKVIETLKKLQAEQQNPLCLELDLDPTDVLIRKYFLNYRGASETGLRLTDFGLLTMRCFFKSYDIELQSDYKPHNTHVRYLDYHCKLPWHLKANHLILFEQEMALKAKLTGDLDLLVASFSPGRK